MHDFNIYDANTSQIDLRNVNVAAESKNNN